MRRSVVFLSSWLSLQGRRYYYCQGYQASLFGIHRCYSSQHHQVLPATTTTSSSSSNHDIDHVQNDDYVTLAEEAFSILAKRGKTWQRLKHLVDLANTNSNSSKNNNNKNSIVSSLPTFVDIGTDHGILPIALAVSGGRRRKAIGVDRSEQALENGAKSLLKQVQDYLMMNVTESTLDESVTSTTALHVEFRCGNGLSCIKPGEADIITIAGMGVHSIMNILVESSDIDRVGCQQVLIQPTNSKPRNLVKVYDALQSKGWIVQDERIEYLSSRWYISALFIRSAPSSSTTKGPSKSTLDLPGTWLHELEATNPMKITFNDYVKHHCTWLEKDEILAGKLDEEEQRWLDKFCHT